MSIKNSRGFTFLEVMIALAIIAGVVFTVVASLNFHISVVEKNRNMVVATFLAREKYEETRLLGPPSPDNGSFDEPFEDFHWKYSKGTFLFDEINKINVVVSWDNNESIEIETYEEAKK